jgi:hypothetical protein
MTDPWSEKVIRIPGVSSGIEGSLAHTKEKAKCISLK